MIIPEGVLQGILLFAAAMMAGGMNAIAGGGSFILFPVMVFTGVPPISANATNTISLWPGSVASIGPYRKELAKYDFRHIAGLIVVSLIGGYLGARLLLATPESTFEAILPFLLLFATLIFTFNKRVTATMRRVFGHSMMQMGGRTSVLGVLFQLLIATYGGYFGGGIGILMLTLLSLMGMENIHTMNALKVVLATMINGVAVVLFLMAGVVDWNVAAITVIGGISGGYLGASLALRLDPKVARRIVVAIAFIITIRFFLTTYFFPG